MAGSGYMAVGYEDFVTDRPARLPMLNTDDLAEIAAVAQKILRKTPYGVIPATIPLERGAIPLQAVTSDSPREQLGPDELRADYSLTTANIVIRCGGVSLPDTPECLNHIVRVLTHEATHAIQRDNFSAEEQAAASNLSKAAATSEAAEDYLAYMTCPVELPGHAAMVAADIRDQALAPEDFETAARSSWSFQYIAAKLEGATAADGALAKVLTAAREYHAAMRRVGRESPAEN
jgi:hypothetical protein